MVLSRPVMVAACLGLMAWCGKAQQLVQNDDLSAEDDPNVIIFTMVSTMTSLSTRTVLSDSVPSQVSFNSDLSPTTSPTSDLSISTFLSTETSFSTITLSGSSPTDSPTPNVIIHTYFRTEPYFSTITLTSTPTNTATATPPRRFRRVCIEIQGLITTSEATYIDESYTTYIGNGNNGNVSDLSIAQTYLLFDNGSLAVGEQDNWVSTTEHAASMLLAGSREIGDVTTYWSTETDSELCWHNAAFANGQAGFCLDDYQRVNAVFDGNPIQGCDPVRLVAVRPADSTSRTPTQGSQGSGNNIGGDGGAGGWRPPGGGGGGGEGPAGWGRPGGWDRPGGWERPGGGGGPGGDFSEEIGQDTEPGCRPGTESSTGSGWSSWWRRSVRNAARW